MLNSVLAFLIVIAILMIGVAVQEFMEYRNDRKD